MSILVICWALLGGLLGQQPAPSSAAAKSLDFDFFKTKVQPIFLAKRPGHARCVSCHGGSQASGLKLQPLSPGSKTWNDEQARKKEMNEEAREKRTAQEGQVKAR